MKNVLCYLWSRIDAVKALFAYFDFCWRPLISLQEHLATILIIDGALKFQCARLLTRPIDAIMMPSLVKTILNSDYLMKSAPDHTAATKKSSI